MTWVYKEVGQISSDNFWASEIIRAVLSGKIQGLLTGILNLMGKYCYLLKLSLVKGQRCSKIVLHARFSSAGARE